MKYILLSLLALSLTACIDSDDNDPYAAVKLNEFTITDTNNTIVSSSSNETAIIKNSSGKVTFDIGFKGKFNSGAHVEFFLSNNKTSTSSSNKFFHINCGDTVSAVSNCKNSYSTACDIDRNGTIWCDDFGAKGFSDIAMGSEKYVVAQACNVLSEECSKQSIPVRFE